MSNEEELINEFKSQLESFLNTTSYHKFIRNETRHIHSHRKGVHDLNTVEGVEGVLEELRYLEWRDNAYFTLAILLSEYTGSLSNNSLINIISLIEDTYNKRDELLQELLEKNKE